MAEIIDELVAKRLRIVDDDGRTRIDLSTFESGSPIIEIYDEDERRRAFLGFDRTNPRELNLAIADSSGRTSADIRVDASGFTSQTFYGQGASRISITSDSGIPVIELTGQDGRSQLVLRVREDGIPEVMLFYVDGSLLFRVPQVSDKRPEGTTIQ